MSDKALERIHKREAEIHAAAHRAISKNVPAIQRAHRQIDRRAKELDRSILYREGGTFGGEAERKTELVKGFRMFSSIALAGLESRVVIGEEIRSWIPFIESVVNEERLGFYRPLRPFWTVQEEVSDGLSSLRREFLLGNRPALRQCFGRLQQCLDEMRAICESDEGVPELGMMPDFSIFQKIFKG